MNGKGMTEYLEGAMPALRETVTKLEGAFDYVSILGTDCDGTNYRVAPGESRVADSAWRERGFAVRAQRDGRVAEYSTTANPDASFAETAREALEAAFAAAGDSRRYPPLPDEKAILSRKVEPVRDAGLADPSAVLGTLEAARKTIQDGRGEIAFAAVIAEFVTVSKVFLSPNRELSQGFPWGQAYLRAVARRGDVTKGNYRAVSGIGGLELLDGLPGIAGPFGDETLELLGAGRIEPGEYDVILDPDVAGTLAHEAFGHGVETDMFVKGRAKAAEYLGKRVASPIVQMYDGAAGAEHCGSFLFDDEGTLATKTRIIEDGILVSGISDALSALSLGFAPTGNGRRQSFSHKAYARMTNTYFGPGDSTLDGMIASTRRGWLLQKLESGMEDPKNWGIQLVVLAGREIVDGKLSGRLVSPVVCSGYVPDVLESVSMVSRDFELSGSGMCGKGYKEYVKVSTGGPYVKARMRLG